MHNNISGMQQKACNYSGFYSSYGKRLFDFIAGLTGLILLSPLFIVIGLAIKLTDTGPVFYKQIRTGQNFKPFYLIKFRSMVANEDKLGSMLTAKGDPRITGIGKFLRKTKLDELPQLINVIKGDMSFVGPRPEVEKYVLLFKEEYNDILKVKPGITDYAAIEFRDEEEVLKSFENHEDGYIKEVLPIKIKLYKKYIKNKGFITDVRLVFLSLWRVVK